MKLPTAEDFADNLDNRRREVYLCKSFGSFDGDEKLESVR